MAWELHSSLLGLNVSWLPTLLESLIRVRIGLPLSLQQRDQTLITVKGS